MAQLTGKIMVGANREKWRWQGNFFMERATRIRNVNIARHNGI